MLVRSSRELLGGLADVVAGGRLAFQSRSAVLLVLWLLHQVPLVVGTGASDPGGAERTRGSLLFQIVEVAVLIARSQKACLLLALVRRPYRICEERKNVKLVYCVNQILISFHY